MFPSKDPQKFNSSSIFLAQESDKTKEDQDAQTTDEIENKEEVLEVESKQEDSTLDREVSALISQANNYIKDGKYAEALPLFTILKPLTELKPLTDHPSPNEAQIQIINRIICLHGINLCYNELKKTNENRDEIMKNFEEALGIISKNFLLLNNVPFAKFIIEKLYNIHLKIFFGYSDHPGNDLSRTEDYKCFILCGVRGIQMNENNAQQRKFYVDSLNTHVSAKHTLPFLPLTGPISNQQLHLWENLVNEKIERQSLLSPENLYNQAVSLINEKWYPKEAIKILENTLKMYSDKKDLTSKINKIKANILLARCYTENKEVNAGGTDKLLAAIHQINSLKINDPTIPPTWSLYLEYGLALLNDNKIVKAGQELKKAKHSADYFKETPSFHGVDPLKTLRKLAIRLYKHTQTIAPSVTVESLETLLCMIRELNKKPKDQLVESFIQKSTEQLAQLKKHVEFLENVNKKEIEKKEEKPEKTVDLLAPKAVPEKTAEQLKAEEEEQRNKAERERRKAELKKEKELKEKAERQKKKEEVSLALKSFEIEAAKAKEEAFKSQQLESAITKKTRSKIKGESQLSEKQKRRLARELTKTTPAEKPRHQATEEVVIHKPKKPIKIANKTQKEREEEKQAEAESIRLMIAAQNKKAAKELAKEKKSKVAEQKKAVKEHELKEAPRLEAIRKRQEALKNEIEEKQLIDIAQREMFLKNEITPLEIKESESDYNEIHSGLIATALALHFADQDPHAEIKKNKILYQLKLFNDAINKEPELKDLEVIIQGTSALEFYLAQKKGVHINLDASDIDLFIYNAPEKDTPAYQKLQSILEKYKFNLKKDTDSYSNYICEYQEKIQLTVAQEKYVSNDPFYFTRGKLRFSDKNGLELINPEELNLMEEMILECDLIKLNDLYIVNFFNRLLKYYEKAFSNGFSLGDNFKTALGLTEEKNDWQYIYFSGKFLTEESSGNTHSNYLEMISVIKSGFFNSEKVLPETLTAAKILLTNFCEALYFHRFKRKAVNEYKRMIPLMSEFLSVYYANGSHTDSFAADINFLMDNREVLTRNPLILKILTAYYSKKDSKLGSLTTDFDFLIKQNLRSKSVECWVSELMAINNRPEKSDLESFEQPCQSIPYYSFVPQLNHFMPMQPMSIYSVPSMPVMIPPPQSYFLPGIFTPMPVHPAPLPVPVMLPQNPFSQMDWPLPMPIYSAPPQPVGLSTASIFSSMTESPMLHTPSQASRASSFSFTGRRQPSSLLPNLGVFSPTATTIESSPTPSSLISRGSSFSPKFNISETEE